VNTLFRSTESKPSDISKPEHRNAPDTKNLVSNPELPGSKTIKKSKEYAAPVRDFANYLMEMEPRASRHTALRVAMGLWHIESEIKPSLHNIDDDHTFLRLAAKQNGFLVRRIEGDLNLVKRLNLPAILALHPSEDLSPVYLTVIQTDDNKITLRNGVEDSVMAVEPDDLKSCWSGVAYIPWKNFFSLTGTIPSDAPGDTIITLKMLLRDIGYNEIEISPVYDEDTQLAIKNIQKKHGLGVDGIVGSSTKIVLYNEKKSLEIPHITRQ
jgi:general secretion pathway protein A